MSDINDFKDEYEADKAAKEAAAQKEKEAEHEKGLEQYRLQQAEERRKRIAAEQPIYSAICRLMAMNLAAQEKVHLTAEDNKLTFTAKNGHQIELNWCIEIKEEYTRHHTWLSKPTGKYRVSIGDYGHRTSYPQKKDGSFSYDKIANELLGWGRRKAEAKALEAQRANNSATVLPQFLEANKGLVSEYYGPVSARASVTSEGPIFLKIEWQHACTVARAQEIVDALQAVGIIKRRE